MKKLLIICILFVSITLFAGTPHGAIAVVLNSDGTIPASVTYQAYYTIQPGNVLDESSYGCFYDPSVGMIYIQCGEFIPKWAPGDMVHIDIINPINSEFGQADVVLTTNAFDWFLPNPCVLGCAPGTGTGTSENGESTFIDVCPIDLGKGPIDPDVTFDPAEDLGPDAVTEVREALAAELPESPPEHQNGVEERPYEPGD